MPDAFPVQEICTKLKRALDLVDKPSEWRKADELIQKAKRLLEPVSVHSKTPGATNAWVQLEGILPLLSPETSGSDGSRESAQGRIQSAVAYLCKDLDV